MMKTIKNKWTLVASLALLFIAYVPLQAQDLCEGIPYCPREGQTFRFAAELIYWQPCYGDLDFAARGGPNSKDPSEFFYQYESFRPDWQPGVRIRAEKINICHGWDLMGSYSWIKPSFDMGIVERATAEKMTNLLLHPDLSDLLVFPYDFISAHWHSTYQFWDLLLGCPLAICESQQWKPYFGMAGILLSQKIQTMSDHITDTPDGTLYTNWNSKYWGLGLKIGTNFRYLLGDGFHLIADGSVIIVAGEAVTTNRQKFIPTFSSNPIILNFKDQKVCSMVPGFHLLTGIEYRTGFCDWDIGLHLGYEFVKWYGTPTPRRFFGDVSGDIAEVTEIPRSTSSTTSSIGYQGLFAGVDIRF